MMFDVLYHDGCGVTGRPLRERRARLEDVVAGSELVFPVRRLAAGRPVSVTRQTRGQRRRVGNPDPLLGDRHAVALQMVAASHVANLRTGLRGHVCVGLIGGSWQVDGRLIWNGEYDAWEEVGEETTRATLPEVDAGALPLGDGRGSDRQQ
jgi:hypothetical protein